MTLDQAKAVYLKAGGSPDHSPVEWQDVHREMNEIVAAPSVKEAADVIRWWGCWREDLTAKEFAERVRDEWGRTKS